MKEQTADAVRPVVEWLQTQGLVLGARILSAALILLVGAFVIKCISAFIRRTLEQRVKGENEMLIKFVVSVAVKTCWALLSSHSRKPFCRSAASASRAWGYSRMYSMELIRNS